jgi:dienelactone hydrolase
MLLAAWALVAAMPTVALGQSSGAAAPANHPALLEEITFLTISGNGKPYRLEAAIVRPAAAKGRLPIALLTHGRARFDTNASASNYAPQARDLAYRGYLAVVVIRRGFGRSDGTPGVPTNRPYANCNHDDLRKYFSVESDDLAGALRAVAERPDADGTRAIVIGASVGGGAAIALAARNPPGLKAVVNLAGAMRITDAKGNLLCSQDVPVGALASFGAQTKTPTLWVYSQNDSNFGPETARKLHAAYVAKGGVATLRVVPPLPEDGHHVFERREGRQHWLAALDPFLRAQGLPTWSTQQVDEAMRRFKMPATRRQWLEGYFSLWTPKVMVQAPNGSGGSYTASSVGLEEARKVAAAGCEKSAKTPCVTIMENFDIATPRKP